MQIVSEVEGLKTSIAELTTQVADAKSNQKAAEAECKRIEKEMNEFKNNRDAKLNELKVCQIGSIARSYVTVCLGRDQGKEGRASQADRQRQDSTEGSTDCWPGDWSVDTIDIYWQYTDKMNQLKWKPTS